MLSSSAGNAQSGAVLTGAGYSKPAPFLVAPGQLMTLFFRGIAPLPDGSLRAGDAKVTPLPNTLAGLSLSVSQTGLNGPLQVPLVSVRQERECDAAPPDCYLTSVRLQVPFEVAASVLGPGGFNAPDAEIKVTTDGQPSRSFAIRPVSANTHVLTSCDISDDRNPDSVCNRAAYHSDGRPVDANAPASRGESIVIYAFGLGQTTPAARTGESAIAGLSVLDPGQPRLIVTLTDKFLNASASVPRQFLTQPVNPTPAKIDFAGLTPGQIGAYQMNVPIPSSFETPVACRLSGPDPAVRSNGFVTVTTAQGAENVPICVAQ